MAVSKTPRRAAPAPTFDQATAALRGMKANGESYPADFRRLAEALGVKTAAKTPPKALVELGLPYTEKTWQGLVALPEDRGRLNLPPTTAETAEKLVATLRSLQGQGPMVYPALVESLFEQSDCGRIAAKTKADALKHPTFRHAACLVKFGKRNAAWLAEDAESSGDSSAWIDYTLAERLHKAQPLPVAVPELLKTARLKKLPKAVFERLRVRLDEQVRTDALPESWRGFLLLPQPKSFAEQLSEAREKCGQKRKTGAQRSPTAFKIKELLTALPEKDKTVKSAFGAELEQRLTQDSLPVGWGWVVVGADPVLFRMADVHSASSQGRPTAEAPRSNFNDSTSNDSAGGDFAARFDAAFRRLDDVQGRRNFLKLHALRAALEDIPRERFDAELNLLRRAGKYTLNSSEGNSVALTPEERQAGMFEAGSNLVYVSRK